MRVTFNAFPQTLMRQIESLNQKQVDLQVQLATGQRISTADQDPMAMGRALDTLTEKSHIQTHARNLERGRTVGEFALSAFEQFKVISSGAMTVASRTDGLAMPFDFAARALEVEQLIEQGLRVVNSRVAGEYLFAGGNTTAPPFIADRDGDGRIIGITYEGTTDPEYDLTFRVGEGISASPFPRGAQNEGLGEHLNTMIQLRDALQDQDADAIGALMPALTEGEDQILLNIVETASTLQGLDVTAKLNEARFNELENLVSRELDVDIAQTIVRLNQMQMSYQAALRAGGHLMNQSLLDYIR